jgi:hypothetical protein
MTVILLTEDNLVFIKKCARIHYPHVHSSHMSEALAFGLRQKTHASLLALMKRDAERHLVEFDEARFIERLTQLDPAYVSPDWKWQPPQSQELPNPIWHDCSTADIQTQTRWFQNCQQQGLPWIYITRRRKYARLDWDCISVDSRYDKAFSGDSSHILVDRMFERFQSLAESKKAYFDGSAFVGHIDWLTPNAASKISDEFAIMLYSAYALSLVHLSRARGPA